MHLIGTHRDRYRSCNLVRSRLHKLLHAIAMPLPQPLKRALYRNILGWTVADDAYVGFSYMGTEHGTLEAGSHVGHFNIIRNIGSLHLGRDAHIKDFNHIFGCTPVGMEGARSFRLGDEGHIMSRHFFEVGGAIDIGNRALIGGRGTQIYTHSIIAPEGVDRWKVSDMIIGDGAQVFASAILVHCRVAPGAIVAAGAVLTKSYESTGNERLLIAGNPAVVVGSRGLVADVVDTEVVGAAD